MTAVTADKSSLIDCLDQWTQLDPHRNLYTFLDRNGHELQSYDYEQFWQRTKCLARHLREEHGLQVGNRVLLVYKPGLESVVAFFASVRCGAIPVPVPPPSQRDLRSGMSRMAFVAQDCGAEIALTEYSLQHELDQNDNRDTSDLLRKMRWTATDKIPAQPISEDVSWSDSNEEVLFLQYTSGSTSTPKGVVVTHDNVMHNALATLGSDAAGKIGVSWLPQFHDMGLIGYYLYPAVVGGTTYGFSPVDFLRRPSLWLQTISRVRASFSSSPNFGFEYCLREDKLPTSELSGVDLSSLEWLMNAAEPVSADTYESFYKRFQPYGLKRSAHVVAYGLAENTLAVSHFGRRSLAVERKGLSEGILRIDDPIAVNGNHVRVLSCGTPLAGVDVRIVDPATRHPLSVRQLGEIWLSGPSACRGYWDRAELSREVFCNSVTGPRPESAEYLRTGDLGFIDGDELFVCARVKDLIIVRGVNYHPQDVEAVVERASTKVRSGGVAAFAGGEDQESIVVVAEVLDASDLPDPQEVVHALRTHDFVGPYTIVFVRSKTIARTTSGKLARNLTRRQWLEGSVPDLLTYRTPAFTAEESKSTSLRQHLLAMLQPYGISNNTTLTLEELGIDSLDLVMVVSEIESLIASRDTGELDGEIDGRLLQRLTVEQLFSLLDLLENEPKDSNVLADTLSRLKVEQELDEREAMIRDAHLGEIEMGERYNQETPIENVLLTGPTGFFGPFLVAALLENTQYRFKALVRAESPEHGLFRIREALQQSKLCSNELESRLARRVDIVCGDLSQPLLGLTPSEWQKLAGSVDAVIHNGALVNYSMNYSALKTHNVDGTRELLRLAALERQKPFHFISSTIIFGFTPEPRLLESDDNDEMKHLDFGYGQSKWVAERLVLEAARRGLPVRTYRPSFVSASTTGVASPADITVRLLAFMINHGIAVNALNQISFLPADIAAHNIAAILAAAGKGMDFNELCSSKYHVTVDEFYSIIDLTETITREHGIRFEYFDIPDFVTELKRRCTPEDPLYPLLDFVTRSYLKIERMEKKRYDNRNYRAARDTAGGIHDPTVSETVLYLMSYLEGAGLLRVRSLTRQPRLHQSVG